MQELEEVEVGRGVRWIDSCPPSVGRKIRAMIEIATNAPDRVFEAADVHRAHGSGSGEVEVSTEKALSGEGSDSDRLDAVAAVLYAFAYLREHDHEEVDETGWNREYFSPRYDLDELAEGVNDRLLGGRVEWHFYDGRFIHAGNRVMHANVVEPASILLDSDPKFGKAASAFGAALDRLSEDESSIAITDAAVAVQEFFRAVGVEGNSIADQLNAAQKLKLITEYDRHLLKPIVDWTNADRSKLGKPHYFRDGDISKADAWLMIHVAGALMVRLSGEEPRDLKRAKEWRVERARRAQDQKEMEKREGAASSMERGGSAVNPWASSNPDESPF